MQHPIFNKRKNTVLYFSSWIPTVAVHYFFLANNTDIVTCLLPQAIIYSVVFAIVGLSAWWVVNYNRLENSNQWSFLTSHVIAAVLQITLWMVLSSIVIGVVCHTEIVLFSQQYLPEHVAAGIFYYLILNLLFYLDLTIKEKQEKVMAEERMARLAKESELRALKSQINPHFLFNSLNSANYLTATNPKAAGEMLVKLADYLRFSLKKGEKEKVTLHNELENCKRYLELEQYRFGDKLQQNWDLEERCKDLMLPVMLLQPLFENAVKHGVYESIDPVAITVKTFLKGETLQIEISNSFDPEAIARKGEGMGLKIVSDRLRIIYGQPGLLSTYKTSNNFKAVVSIPISN